MVEYFKDGDYEYIRLRDYKNEEENYDFQETNFGGSDETNLDDDDLLNTNVDDVNQDNNNPLLDLNRKLQEENDRLDVFTRILDKRAYEGLNIVNFLGDVIDAPMEYKNPRFIKYLMDKHNFKLNYKITSFYLKWDYKIKYNGKPYTNNNRLMIIPAREFQIKNGDFQNNDKFDKCRGDLDYLYDEWENEVRKKRIKKAGLIRGVVLAIAGVWYLAYHWV